MNEYRIIGYVRSMDEAKKYVAGKVCMYGEQELKREFALGGVVTVSKAGEEYTAFDTQWLRIAEYKQV